MSVQPLSHGRVGPVDRSYSRHATATGSPIVADGHRRPASGWRGGPTTSSLVRSAARPGPSNGDRSQVPCGAPDDRFPAI